MKKEKEYDGITKELAQQNRKTILAISDRKRSCILIIKT
jgi:hypothetical protein